MINLHKAHGTLYMCTNLDELQTLSNDAQSSCVDLRLAMAWESGRLRDEVAHHDPPPR